MEKQREATDGELVQVFLRHQAAGAFEALYDRHTPYLFRVALRMLNGNRTTAEDVLQEAWIRAVTSLSRFRGESSLRTWLCGITMNCCRETWRRRELLPLEEVAESLAEGPDESAQLDSIHLERALNRLDEASREVIELYDVLGHSHDEVASILGIATGTSKSRLFRARETLRRFLRTDIKSGEE